MRAEVPRIISTPVWFRRVKPDDSAITLRWRQDPDISRFMYTDLNHDEPEQRKWIVSCLYRSDFQHFIIMAKDREIGYLSFSDIDQINRRCSTGNYIYNRDDRRHYSGLLHTFIMDYCFNLLGCHKIVNTIMVGNERNVKIQRILRFRHVGIYKDHIYKYGIYHDVHVFELLASEWAAHRRLFPLEKTLAAFVD